MGISNFNRKKAITAIANPSAFSRPSATYFTVSKPSVTASIAPKSPISAETAKTAKILSENKHNTNPPKF